MKKVVAIISVVLTASIMGFANLIDDPDFEGVGAGTWNDGSSTNAFLRDFDSTAQSHSPDESLQVSWSTTIPQWNATAAEQVFDVTEDDPWNAYAWARITTPLDNAEAYLETIFYNSSWQETGKLQSASLSDTTDWTQLFNTGTVPTNAVHARVRLVTFTSGGDSDSGTVYWDDIYANIPEPASIVLAALGLGILWYNRRRK